MTIAIGGPFEEDVYTESDHGRSRAWGVSADTRSGALEEVAPILLAGDQIGGLGFFGPDLDGRGAPDLLVFGAFELQDTVALVLPSEPGVTRRDAWARLVDTDGWPGNPAPCGDLDGDGVSELCLGATPTRAAQILWGPLTDGSTTVWSAGRDLDGDGDDEALLCDPNAAACQLVDDPAGPVVALWDAPTFRGDGEGVLVGDLDGDGLGEVMVGRSFWVGRDGGSSADAFWTLDPDEGWVDSAVSGDFDGDGHADLAVDVSRRDHHRTLVFSGPLTGGLSDHGEVTRTLPGGELAAADVNGDGVDDLVIGSSAAHQLAGEVRLYLGRSP